MIAPPILKMCSGNPLLACNDAQASSASSLATDLASVGRVSDLCDMANPLQASKRSCQPSRFTQCCTGRRSSS